MTAAVFAHTDWSFPRLNGSSVALHRLAKEGTRTAPIQRGGVAVGAADLFLSIGVSASASIVQNMTRDLVDDIRERLTIVPEGPDVMARLRATSSQGDERAFIRVCQTIDWQIRSANDHIAAIQLALAAGAHLTARHLALEAAQRFPDHGEIQKYAHVLSPPSVTKSALPADPSVEANRDWLSTHGDLYRGQWVALRNGQLLGVAASPNALRVEVGNERGVLLTKVY